MRKIAKILICLVTFTTIFIAGNSLAVDPVTQGDVGSNIPTASNPSAPFSDQLAMVLNILLALASTVAVLFIIIGGYTYITSAGNQDRQKKAKEVLIGAIVGLVIIILSFGVVNFINEFLAR